MGRKQGSRTDKSNNNNSKKVDVSSEITDDVLSEHYTVAGSIGDNDSSFAAWDDDGDGEGAGDGTSSWDTDALIQNGADHVEAAEAAARDAARRRQLLADGLNLLANMNYEKRAVVREKILRQNFNLLSTTAKGWDVLVSNLDGVASACQNAFLRGGPAEQYAACRVLEVMAMVLGRHEEDFVETYIMQLRQKCTTKETTVRRAALRTYATAILVCAHTDHGLRNAALDWYESFVQVSGEPGDDHGGATTSVNASAPSSQPPAHHVPELLQATAWDCWTLLATLLPDDELAGEHEGRGPLLLEAMRMGLDSATFELRSAAGLAATLVHEARLNLGSDEGNVTARQFQRGSWDGSAYEDTVNEIQQRVAELAVESGKKSGGGGGGQRKAVKRLRRATFREYAATLVDHEGPTETVHFRNHGSLEITTWKDLIVLNHVRQCLQGGFQVQLLSNPTLQAMLSVDRTMMSANNFGGGSNLMNNLLSAEEKRVVQSKTSTAVKSADQDRRGRRDKRENVKNYFLTADDE